MKGGWRFYPSRENIDYENQNDLNVKSQQSLIFASLSWGTMLVRCFLNSYPDSRPTLGCRKSGYETLNLFWRFDVSFLNSYSDPLPTFGRRRTGTRHSRCRWQHFVMAITCINCFTFDRRPEYCWDHQCQNQEITYILIDWVGGPNGKILSSRSWRASRSRKMQKNSISARPDGFDRTGSHQPVRPCAS